MSCHSELLLYNYPTTTVFNYMIIYVNVVTTITNPSMNQIVVTTVNGDDVLSQEFLSHSNTYIVNSIALFIVYKYYLPLVLQTPAPCHPVTLTLCA